MIRLKQAMGNVIRGKIEPEYMISKYECNLLSSCPIHNLLTIQTDKATITYSGDIKKTLSSKIATGIGETELLDYMYQIVQVIMELDKVGLNSKRLVLNPEWIFISQDDTSLKFIYYPVNGVSNQYDAVLFLRDLALRANLNTSMREQLNAWITCLGKTGFTDGNLTKIPNNRKSDTKKVENKEEERYHWLDDDGESPTATDGENAWEPFNQLDEDGEALTGTDEVNGWSIPSEQTSFDDTCIFTNNGSDDGTYSESNSEPFSIAGSHSSQNIPTLLRISTGEKKKITKDGFRLGRSEQRTDFCIRNNSGVSNVHAMIQYTNGKYYIKDNHSTNGTYVNGVKIEASGAPVLLQDGTVIRLYNEEIIFNL